MVDRCEYFTSRYSVQFRMVRRYAVTGTSECVCLGAGAYAFWARLPNGYDVAVSNNEMDGVPGGSDRFTVCVYLDGGFIANLPDGTLDEQLRRASDGEFTKAAIPAAAAADRARTLTTLYTEEIQALESAGWESVHPVGTGGGCTAIQAHKGQRYLLATDGDHALVRGRDDEQSTGWLLSLYDTHCADGAIASAEAPTLMSALTRALAAQDT
ncbi:hypothetical protein CRH09_30510 [Nocardia terpenica]|uniref:Uncharacterized protein n=1 Tax=Nocardia terpenica TaxID=455432 RepID=A0A291RQG8_9NOCA|nr:hypothetical protein CRH09_30510 [Nocardia terpenica]